MACKYNWAISAQQIAKLPQNAGAGIFYSPREPR
jgi:hypothetical protein